MNTLIIPCAGKSSRFPNMKPKWMLTHPDGQIMVQKALSGLNLEIFDRVIITIVKEHDAKYEAALILKQVFQDNSKVEICILDEFTSSASETIMLTLNIMNVYGSIVIKDSDNLVKVNITDNITNFVVGCDLHKNPNISNIPAKSFLVVNEQSLIQDIIEKQVVSNIICLGVYAFADVDIFKNTYRILQAKNLQGEMYISHIISYLLSTKKMVFEYKDSFGFEDWGTLADWEMVQKQHRTFFVDVDGVIMKNCGKYGSVNWDNNTMVLTENLQAIKGLQDEGAQIVITTSRPEKFKQPLEKLLNSHGIFPHCIINGLNHSARVLINDFAPTNPYPSAIAINISRNGSLKEFL